MNPGLIRTLLRERWVSTNMGFLSIHTGVVCAQVERGQRGEGPEVSGEG